MSFSFKSVYLDSPLVDGRVFDLFTPADSRRSLAIFLVHGGGWRTGSRTLFHRLMQALNGSGFIAASTDYRLSEVRIEQQLMDVRDSYRSFLRELRAMGGPQRVVVMGSSAGAHLAALLAMSAASEDVPSPIGQALYSCPVTFEPWAEIFPPIWAAMQDIVGVPYASHPECYRLVSPIARLTESTPPILLGIPACEHMIPREESDRFVARARELGVRVIVKEYRRAEHGFFYDVQRPVQEQALADLLEFLDQLEGHEPRVCALSRKPL